MPAAAQALMPLSEPANDDRRIPVRGGPIIACEADVLALLAAAPADRFLAPAPASTIAGTRHVVRHLVGATPHPWNATTLHPVDDALAARLTDRAYQHAVGKDPTAPLVLATWDDMLVLPTSRFAISPVQQPAPPPPHITRR